MTREVMRDLLKQLEFFDKSSHLHGCTWQRSHIAKIKAVLAQPVQPAKKIDDAKISELALTFIGRYTKAEHNFATALFNANKAAQPVQPAVSVAASEPPLSGRWHHGGGCLVSGTIRIAKWDCDTSPPVEFREDMLDWVCEALNAAVNLWEENTQVNAQPVQPATGEDLILIPRGLIGAACAAIDKKRDAPQLLKTLRVYTMTAQPVQPVQPAAVPAGWKLVPICLAPQMREQLLMCGRFTVAETYTMLLAAAPQPPVQPTTSDRMAYEGAWEDLLIWKRRALEAEAKLKDKNT